MLWGAKVGIVHETGKHKPDMINDKLCSETQYLLFAVHTVYIRFLNLGHTNHHLPLHMAFDSRH